jgi:hypothetical protein
MATINWDEIELLPRYDCCVCSTHAVPWGRTTDDRYFCSRYCCDAYSQGQRTMVAMTAKLSRPANDANLLSPVVIPRHARV